MITKIITLILTRFLLISLLLLVPANLLADNLINGEIFKTVTSFGKVYSVDIPGTTIRGTTLVTSNGDDILYTIESRVNGVLYSSSHIKIPYNVLNAKTIDAILHDSKKGTINGIGGTLINENSTSIKSFKGIKYMVKLPNGNIMKSYQYIANDFLIHMSVISTPHVTEDKKIDYFFNSLKIN